MSPWGPSYASGALKRDGCAGFRAGLTVAKGSPLTFRRAGGLDLREQVRLDTALSERWGVTFCGPR
ncbi:hypothetical protein [Streptomyces sp. NPDC005953]|uniref:hypothetical protein n=1 Tax=Streptomyces sp. NPDC005953 TaxID=3156719 RepID=UPI0033D9D40B